MKLEREYNVENIDELKDMIIEYVNTEEECLETSNIIEEKIPLYLLKHARTRINGRMNSLVHYVELYHREKIYDKLENTTSELARVVTALNYIDDVINEKEILMKEQNKEEVKRSQDLYEEKVEKLESYISFETLVETCTNETPIALFDREEIKKEIMYVLSNKERVYGYEVTKDESALNKVHDLLGCDFYVIPSSIHEAVIVPYSCSPSLEEMQKMKEEIDEKQVIPEERSQEKVWLYTRE